MFEQLVGAGNLSAKEKSILDRCTADVYREYIRSGYKSEVPTLKDLYRQLMLQPEEEEMCIRDRDKALPGLYGRAGDAAGITGNGSIY